MRDIVPCEGRFSRIAMMESGFIELLKEKMAGIPGIRGAADIPGVELQQMAEKVWQKKIVKNFTGTEKYNVEIPRGWITGRKPRQTEHVVIYELVANPFPYPAPPSRMLCGGR